VGRDLSGRQAQESSNRWRHSTNDRGCSNLAGRRLAIGRDYLLRGFAVRLSSACRPTAELHSRTTLNAGVGENSHRFPQLFPGGEALLFTVSVVVSADNGEGVGLWMVDVARGTVQPLVREYRNETPFWSSDEMRIIFSSNRGGGPSTLFSLRLDRTADPELIRLSQEWDFATSVTPDGRGVLYGEVSAATGWDIWLQRLDQSGAARKLLGARSSTRANTICCRRSSRLRRASSCRRGGYSHETRGVSYVLGQQRQVSGRLSGATGTLYGGTKSEVTYTGRWGVVRNSRWSPA
jgi:hypothetical protein